jgi:hypothetical protein
MRQIRFAAMALGLALVVAACASATPESDAPAASLSQSPGTDPSAPASAPPTQARSPAPSAAASFAPGAADEVLDAALATQAEGTVRFAVDVRSADAADAMPPVTGNGQVSFGDPSQFRFASPGMTGIMAPYEVIFDGANVFSRGRDTPYLPADTWVTFEITPGTIAHAALLRQYGDYTLVLVTPLGVTSAVPADDEVIGNRQVRRYVTQVDIAASRPHLPESLLPAYDSHVETFTAAGVPLTHEVEIWMDEERRIAKMRYVQDLEGQDIEALVITYDFEGYGEPMEAAPAPGDEVLTIEEAQERRQAAETASPS